MQTAIADQIDAFRSRYSPFGKRIIDATRPARRASRPQRPSVAAGARATTRCTRRIVRRSAISRSARPISSRTPSPIRRAPICGQAYRVAMNAGYASARASRQPEQSVRQRDGLWPAGRDRRRGGRPAIRAASSVGNRIVHEAARAVASRACECRNDCRFPSPASPDYTPATSCS